MNRNEQYTPRQIVELKYTNLKRYTTSLTGGKRTQLSVVTTPYPVLPTAVLLFKLTLAGFLADACQGELQV